MKKIIIAFAIFSFAISTNAQIDSNIKLGLSSPANGVKINANFPSGKGGWARGFHIADQASKPFITFGTYGSYDQGVSSPIYSYIGKAYNDTYMVFKPNGHIGVGTSAPARLFEIRQKNDPNTDYGLMISEPSNNQKVYLHLANNASGQYGYLGLGGNTILRGNKQNSSFDGKVGISTTNPLGKLDLGTSLGANNGLKIGNYIEINERETINNAGTLSFNAVIDKNDVSKFKPIWTGSSATSGMVMTMASGGVSDLTFYGYNWGRNDTPKSLNEFTKVLHLSTKGKVGIGTTNPSQQLDVNGHVKFDALASNHTNLQIGHDSNDRIFADNSPAKSYGGGMFFRVHNESISAKYIDAMMITENGNIGIGARDPKGFKLGVNGKIAATEVKVATYSNWPDFVFKKEYKLPTLVEVENHIKEKGHLKNISSAKEVEKDGFFLGEMDAKLLQKIEELTLYTIQQEKKLEKQNKDIEELKTLVKQLIETKK